MRDTPEEKHVIEVATRLFAELGYDGTSLRMIADAAGVDPVALNARTGGKLPLYLTVMERAHQIEEAAVDAALASYTPTRRGLADLAEAYLDFHVANPRIMWLWVHRWMGDAVDTPDLEERYRRQLIARVTDAMREAVPPDVDVDHLLWVFIWSLAGFLSGGIMHGRPRTRAEREAFVRGRADVIAPETLENFRSFLHVLVDRMTSPREPR